VKKVFRYLPRSKNRKGEKGKEEENPCLLHSYDEEEWPKKGEEEREKSSLFSHHPLPGLREKEGAKAAFAPSNPSDKKRN